VPGYFNFFSEKLHNEKTISFSFAVSEILLNFVAQKKILIPTT